jgi:hypothetical protein
LADKEKHYNRLAKKNATQILDGIFLMVTTI